MNTNLDFIRESAHNMYVDKLDNMTNNEITERVSDFLDDKEDEVVDKLCELLMNNEIVNTDTNIRALDGLETYLLTMRGI